MKKRSRFWLPVLGTVGVILLGLALQWALQPRHRAEREHGLRLPGTARQIQCRGDAWKGFLDRGAVALFQLPSGELPGFLGQLSIRSESAPAHATGDPLVNGWNVWPTGSATFVPGNSKFGNLQKTWAGSAKPVRMLSCDSPKGDWLHVELWELDSTDSEALVKLYTDWN